MTFPLLFIIYSIIVALDSKVEFKESYEYWFSAYKYKLWNKLAISIRSSTCYFLSFPISFLMIFSFLQINRFVFLLFIVIFLFFFLFVWILLFWFRKKSERVETIVVAATFSTIVTFHKFIEIWILFDWIKIGITADRWKISKSNFECIFKIRNGLCLFIIIIIWLIVPCMIALKRAYIYKYELMKNDNTKSEKLQFILRKNIWFSFHSSCENICSVIVCRELIPG